MKLSEKFSQYSLYLILVTFVFVATSSLAISKAERKNNNQTESYVISFPTHEKSFVSLPTLKADVVYPTLTAESIYAVDTKSGITLFEKNPDKRLLPASTTKIITALVALDYYPRDAILTVGEIGVDGKKMDLVAGEKITVDALVKGLLINSANDAAEVLANNYPGGRGVFIQTMNLKAREANLVNTLFTNPSGLDTNGHSTTARDLVRAATYAMENSYFSEIVATKEITVSSIDGSVVHRLTNINELIGEVQGVLGVKTGWTEIANENLVTYIERDGREIMISLLSSQDRFGETKEIINWIFENYTWEEVKYP